MNCDECRQHWSLYYDSEGDGEVCFQINRHLDLCPACAEWFHQQNRLEGMLESKLRAPLVPESESSLMWQNVLANAGLHKPAPARRWFSPGVLAVVTACVVLALLVYWPRASGTSPDLAHLGAGYHERLLLGHSPVDFSSSSDLEVEKYLVERVNFPVRCPPRRDSGFAVRGAGVSTLADSPVAFVVGDVNGSPVSIFILPADSLARFPRQQAELADRSVHACTEGEYEMVMGTIDRSVVLVIGKRATADLQRVLRAYGSYPHDNSAGFDGASIDSVTVSLRL